MTSDWTLSPQHEFTLDLTRGETHYAGEPTASGQRAIGEVVAGTVSGTRINGSIFGPSADWVLIVPDGFGRIDVRTQIRTDDDAVIYVRYEGYMETNEAALAAILDPAGPGTDFDQAYLGIAVKLETGDPRYSWVNTTQFVGRGRLTKPGVVYEVYSI
ncbi:DUF3237 domain-containing protein [Aeromicrobium sp. CFBP 8757]|uniref:DUF3237 domain-containing protein n=1 Tax=Aeromicrobium sp. CFBP 8757 TaxID=2775288 RepID=UPI00177CB1FD|nr:DUF3237 domain-containing protein [Aeromicrobium sp. CFBP 8757]MBD8605449.1 DUF3237 domain-containing protein [Aeromicrobium sp. CFBP 8757]